MQSEEREPRSIHRVAVIGAGTMGAQIAALAACGGREVRLYDALPDAVVRARGRIAQEIASAIVASGLVAGIRERAGAALTFPATLAEAVDGADLVIEAVKEDVDVKRGVFAELSRLAPDAILATNSSSIPSALIAPAVDRPERLLNMHFFAPIWVRSMLELMGCGETSDAAMSAAGDFGRSLGLVTASVNGQSKGFILNRIWRAVKRESLRVVDEGIAGPEDIDRLWMMFFQTGYAPFGVMDMVGLDVVRDIETSYQRESADPSDTPSATLARMLADGRLGEKSGRGFYSHPNPRYADADFLMQPKGD